MPRPHLTVVLSARLPHDVAAAWRASADACGLSMSDWLRQAVAPDAVRVVGRPARRRASRAAVDIDPALIAQVARYGNNLNQLARLANIGALSGRPVDVLRVLRAIEVALHALSGRDRDAR